MGRVWAVWHGALALGQHLHSGMLLYGCSASAGAGPLGPRGLQRPRILCRLHPSENLDFKISTSCTIFLRNKITKRSNFSFNWPITAHSPTGYPACFFLPFFHWPITSRAVYNECIDETKINCSAHKSKYHQLNKCAGVSIYYPIIWSLRSLLRSKNSHVNRRKKIRNYPPLTLKKISLK